MRIELDNNLHLHGAPEKLAAQFCAQFTLDNPLYIAARKAGRYTGNLPPTLSFYERANGSLTLPRGAANSIVRRAKEHAPVEVEDNRLVLPEIDLTFRGSLRPYQQQACNGALDSSMSVVEAGTGSGKTVMAEVVRQFIQSAPHRVDDAHSHGPHVKLAVTDQPRLDAKELLDALPPLVEQLLVVDQNKGRLFPGRDNGAGQNGFASPVAGLNHGHTGTRCTVARLLLVRPQAAAKGQVDLGQDEAIVFYFNRPVLLCCPHDAVGRPPRQGQSAVGPLVEA